VLAVLRVLSYGYWALIAVTAPFFYAGAAVIWLVTLPFDRRKVVLHLYSSWWAVFFIVINPLWKVRVSGRERLPWKGPAVIVANHASLIDILVLFQLFRPFKWVSKAENFKLPFIGWGMVLNRYVRLVRGDRESVIRMLAACSQLLGRGSAVMFFPEGTRSQDGNLRPFKDGAFELAVEHGVPLIPIAVHGTARALPKHDMVLREHVDAWVQVLEPMDPADYPSVAALREAARDRIEEALATRPGGDPLAPPREPAEIA
jgi:1-acyl-sn-glycerol-3-phosphate acyltransferase